MRPSRQGLTVGSCCTEAAGAYCLAWRPAGEAWSARCARAARGARGDAAVAERGRLLRRVRQRAVLAEGGVERARRGRVPAAARRRYDSFVLGDLGR